MRLTYQVRIVVLKGEPADLPSLLDTSEKDITYFEKLGQLHARYFRSKETIKVLSENSSYLF